MFSNNLKSLTFLLLNSAVYFPGVISLDLYGVPQCGITCTINAYNSIHPSCSMMDIACLCKHKPFIKATKKCYTSTCPPQDIPKLEAYSAKFCPQVAPRVKHQTNSNKEKNSKVPRGIQEKPNKTPVVKPATRHLKPVRRSIKVVSDVYEFVDTLNHWAPRPLTSTENNIPQETSSDGAPMTVDPIVATSHAFKN